MNRLFWIILVVVLAGYSAVTSIIAVKETEIAVISQFGRPVNVIFEAGPAFKLPDPFNTVKRLDKRLQMFQVASAEYGT